MTESSSSRERRSAGLDAAVGVETPPSLDEALDALFEFAGVNGPEHSPVAAMGRALALLGDPNVGLKVIHVTGTSGKTSTCYAIRALLEAAGQRTGLTVSPHITAVNERVQVDGRPIPEAEFCARTGQMLRQLAPMRGQLTYFELVICLALSVFAENQVDYAIVEVGIGGTDDATNVLRGADKIAVIGPVGLDHTEKLGSTVAEIAAHKAGIMVPGGVAFVADQSQEALGVIMASGSQIGADIRVVKPGSFGDDVAESTENPSDGGTPAMRPVFADDEVDRSLPLFQQANWSMAEAVVAHVGRRDGFPVPTPDQVRQISAAGHVESPRGSHHLIPTTPPARFEWIQAGVHHVLLDGAHNPQKVAGLASAIHAQGLPPMPTLATLTQAPPDKIRATLEQLAPLVSRLIVPEFSLGHEGKVKQSAPADQIVRMARELGIEAQAIPDLPTAIATLLRAPESQLLVTGSLYLAALVRPWLVL